MGQVHANQVRTGSLGHESLKGQIVPVGVLDAGRRFDLDHPPGPLSRRSARGQEDVGEGERARRRESCLEHRSPGLQQLGRSREGLCPALLVWIERRAHASRVVEHAGDVPHGIAFVEPRLGSGRIVTPFGMMDLQPEALGALTKSHHLRFGELSHPQSYGQNLEPRARCVNLCRMSPGLVGAHGSVLQGIDTSCCILLGACRNTGVFQQRSPRNVIFLRAPPAVHGRRATTQRRLHGSRPIARCGIGLLRRSPSRDGRRRASHRAPPAVRRSSRSRRHWKWAAVPARWP